MPWTDTIDRRNSFRGRLIDPGKNVKIQGRGATMEVTFLKEPYTSADPPVVTLDIEALDALATADLCTPARPMVASAYVEAGIDTFGGTVSITAPDGSAIVLTLLEESDPDYLGPTVLLGVLAECATRINDKPPS